MTPSRAIQANFGFSSRPTQLDATSAVAIELGLAGHAGACNCGGFPAGYEASAWYGIAAPAGTPAAIVERFNQELNAPLPIPR
jgi:hypothetical protein